MLGKIFFIGILFVLFASCHSSSNDQRPNIILIYADDLGYGEIGAYGQQKIETPNIDRLAKEGMKFTQFYSGAPVCAPARCILLTGMHSGHAAIRGNDEAGHRGDVWNYLAMAANPYLEGQAPMPVETVTLPMLLKDGGYITGMGGKWGLGHPLSESTPNKKGFDYFFGYNCQRQAHTLTPLHLWENDKKIMLNNDTIIIHSELPLGADTLDPKSYAYLDQPDYAPELITGKILDFVERNQDTSFFLYWATPLPHVPLQAPSRWINYYHKKFGSELPYTGLKGGYFPARYPKATYAAMISFMDENIGRLLLKLEELGLSDNTIILFTSDNGPTYVPGTFSQWFDSGGPFLATRGWGKGYLREGGIRVPFVARWPGHIPPGTSTELLSGAQDIVATVLDICELPVTQQLDGISMAPTLLGLDQEKKHDYLYWEFPESEGQRALRWSEWKAYNSDLKRGDTTIQLYNLATDLQEQVNVADKHPDKIDFVRQIFKKEHIPSKNPRWRYNIIDGEL